ncbi:MAG: MFS domain-containing histidine kinase [Cytophagaceae bacterium]|nr:MFS domain-containing histidine kinase [Cytophagaceae bacterium]MDW8456321.1 MFS domain-containing histidine kinase [Cytophagaceae bacterium]
MPFKKHIPLIFSLSIILFSSGLWYLNVHVPSNTKQQEIVNEINQKINEEIKISKAELAQLKKIIQNASSVNFSTLYIPSKYPNYIFIDERPFYWSDYRFVPKYSMIHNIADVDYVSFTNGKYLVLKDSTSKNGILYNLFSCILLQNDYVIENNYIQSGLNEELFQGLQVQINNYQTEQSLNIRGPDNKYLFTLEFSPEYKVINRFWLWSSIILFIAGFIILIVYVLSYLSHLKKTGKAFLSFLILAGLLILFRTLLFGLCSPLREMHYPVFDSKYFASSLISPTLADYLINSLFLLVLTVYFFTVHTRLTWVKKIVKSTQPMRSVYSVLLCSACILTTIYTYEIFYTLYSNSQWPLDITESIEISYYKLIFLLIFFICCIIYFICMHFFITLFARLSDKFFKKQMLALIISGCCVFFGYWYFNEANYILIIMSLVYVSVVAGTRLYSSLMGLKYSTYLYFLWAAVNCSLLGAYALFSYAIKKSQIQKTQFAGHVLEERDVFTEYLLNEVYESIRSDLFIQSRIGTSHLANEQVEQKIKKVLLPDYFSKYDPLVCLFDKSGKAIKKNSPYASYKEAFEKYKKLDFATEYENIFYVNQKNESPLKRYIMLVEVYHNSKIAGYIVIELVHKTNAPNSVYPELLIDKKYIQPANNQNFSYAVYSKDKLVLTSGNFSFDENITLEDLSDERLFNEGVYKEGYHMVATKAYDDKVVVVCSEAYSFRNFYSNYSLLFLVLIFMVFIFIAGYANYHRFKNTYVNYATKIQLYLNIAFFLPLFIVSAVTVSMISNYNKDNINKSYIKKAENLSSNIISHFEDIKEDTLWEAKLQNDISQIANFSDSDIDLFDATGELLYSYHPVIYNQELLSNYINPEAYVKIIEKKMNKIMLTESVGTLKYNCVYVAIKSYSSGDILGVLSIPFFESKQEINDQLIGVLTTIMNIFSSIFILFIGLSYVASQILTIPLNLITQRIKKTSLAGDNKPINWNSKDEIGMLVSEYNSMLVKLEQSKEALTKSEKESAWREMARQVAHEINNPLTPMKLTIQHLQRGWKDKIENIELITQKSLTSLLEQVNILSEIASSFAAFAKMPIPKSEVFDVAKTLKNTVHLYNNNHDVFVESEIQEGVFLIVGDEQLMAAIFTNLILNAIQSVPHHRKASVRIFLKSTDNKTVLIQVQDNGDGIPDEIKEKIFLPNFSTKDKGSGIGLAVAKRGIEHANGKIWFETTLGQGTTFFIELPLCTS